MIEHDIAQYIADNSNLVLGTDLFADHLPAGTDYGVYVKLTNESYDEGSLVAATVNVFVTYSSYYETRSVANTIADLLTAMKGTGAWATGGRAMIDNYGQNLEGDHMMVVSSNIFYEGG